MSIYTNNLNFLKDENLLEKWNGSLTIDGPVSADYDETFPKILWILKEPHQDELARGRAIEGTKSLIDYADVIEDKVLKGHTYRVMIKVSKGILKRVDKFSELDYSQKKDGQILRSTAIINLNKTGGGSTESDDYKNLSNLKIDLVREQIKMLSPDIIICGGTYESIKKHDIISNLPPVGWFEPVTSNSRLIIPAYHPGYYSCAHERYFNSVTQAWDEHRNSR